MNKVYHIRVCFLICLGLISMGFESVVAVPKSGKTFRLLYDNGPFITTQGGGYGSADISEIQTMLGMTTFGENCQIASDLWIADDIVVDETWNLDYIILFAYQPDSTENSTINDVRIQIRDGSPADGGTVIWGDKTTNRFVATGWTHVYRVQDVTPLATNRPIMGTYCSVPVILNPGTYWLEWSIGGTLPSGPWQPPITIKGTTVTGNALHFSTTWQPFRDFGTSAPQGAPFRIVGDRERGVILSFDDLDNEHPVGDHYQGVTFSPGWKAWNSSGYPAYPVYSPPNVAFTEEQDNYIEWDQNVSVVKMYVNCSANGPAWTYTVYDAFGTPLDSFVIPEFVNNYKVELAGRGIRRLEIRGTESWNLFHTIDHLTYELEGPVDCHSDSVFSRAVDDPPDPAVTGHISDEEWEEYAADRFILPPAQQTIRAVQWWGLVSYFPETTFRVAFYTDGGSEPGSLIAYFSGTAVSMPTGYIIDGRMLFYHYLELSSEHMQNNGWISIYGRENSDDFYWATTTTGSGEAVRSVSGVWTPLSENLAFCLLPDVVVPTPTPAPDCTETGCEVYMPSVMFQEGDTCYCEVYVCNAGADTFTDIPLFVLLDVYGMYFFAPSFSQFDNYQQPIPPGLTTLTVLPAFTWPANVGTGSGLVWYAAMTDPQITTLHGKLGTFSFGWN